MPDHLSVSQIKMFLRCPMQYEFGYIKGIKRPPAGVMIVGSAYHNAVASDLKYKKDSGSLLREKDIIDIFSDSFESQVNQKKTEEDGDSEEFEEIDWGEDNPGNAKDIGTRLAILYHKEWVPNIMPVLVEEYQTVEIAGVKFVLISDVVTEDKIIDHKVTTRMYSDSFLASDIQATAYYYVHKKPFEFHLALKQKELKIKPAYTERNNNDCKFFETVVSRVNKAIESGIFPPNPSGYMCSEEYCGYWNICRGKEQK